METHDRMRRRVVRYLLDNFGRLDGKVCPFYVYCKFPNYKPLPSSEEIYLDEFLDKTSTSSYRAMLERLKQEGVAYLEEAQIVEDDVYFQYLRALKYNLSTMGFQFSRHEIEAIFAEAHTLSLKRYARLKRKQERSLKFGGELNFSFPELYDLYGDNLVYFAHGPNGVGKSTWLQVQRKALARRKKVVWDKNGQWLTESLANLQVVDSGEYLPENVQITRGQVVETIPISVNQYQECLRKKGPVAVGDVGDNVGQRVNMLMDVWKFRGSTCPTHAELFDASLLEALVRNESRVRKEYALHLDGIIETYSTISERTTSCYKRDMSSLTYRRMYSLLYTDKWCSAKELCSNKAHEPLVLCERWCKLCPWHCSQMRRGMGHMLHTSDLPVLSIDGVFL